MRSPRTTTAVLLAALPLSLSACGDDAGDVATPAVSPTGDASASASASASPDATSSATEASPDAAAPGPQVTPVSDLGVGDCFDDVPGALNEVTELPVVPCEQPHANEVFALLEQPDGEFPGAEEVQGAAIDGCAGEFEAYVGTPYDASSLTVLPITPTAESWAQGDRQVVCVLTSTEPRTGSAQGSGA